MLHLKVTFDAPSSCAHCDMEPVNNGTLHPCLNIAYGMTGLDVVTFDRDVTHQRNEANHNPTEGHNKESQQ